MAETIGRMSMIKKRCYAIIPPYQFTPLTPCGRGALWEWGEPAGSVGCCTRWGFPTPTKVKNLLPPEPPHMSLEATVWRRSVGARNPHLCMLLLRDIKSEILLDMTTPPWCREKVMVYHQLIE